MEHSHTISALIDRHSALLGELKACESRIQQLQADVANLEGTIRLFHSEWRNEDARPRRHRTPSRWGRHGEGIQTTLQVLREAGVPLTIEQIVERVRMKKGIPTLDPRTLNSMRTSIRASLFKRVGMDITKGRSEGGQAIWGLVQR